MPTILMIVFVVVLGCLAILLTMDVNSIADSSRLRVMKLE